jgi:transcriptional regulator with XRE-family HTH domain
MPRVKKTPVPRSHHFIKEWRAFNQLTQEDAAALIDIDRTFLSKIERLQAQYNQDFLERASVAYKCSPADLISIDPFNDDESRRIFAHFSRADEPTRKTVMAVMKVLLKIDQ